MSYHFFFGITELPINPGALSIKTPSQNKTVTLINDGEINILKEPGLREISFEFLLPQINKYPFANKSAKYATATTFIPILNSMKRLKTAFPFIVTRMDPRGKKIMFFTYMLVQIEDFEYNEDASAHGLDVMCNITLKEWKNYGTKSAKIITNADGTKTLQATEPRPNSKIPLLNYVVNPGDTLWTIAKKVMGNGGQYKELAELNKVSPLGELKEGQTLQIPKIDGIDNKLDILSDLDLGKKLRL